LFLTLHGSVFPAVFAVGGNTWRMSHNPGDPATFDLFDRLGIMSWDENRDYSEAQAG
jgi:hypothetical protein